MESRIVVERYEGGRMTTRYDCGLWGSVSLYMAMAEVTGCHIKEVTKRCIVVSGESSVEREIWFVSPYEDKVHYECKVMVEMIVY